MIVRNAKPGEVWEWRDDVDHYCVAVLLERRPPDRRGERSYWRMLILTDTLCQKDEGGISHWELDETWTKIT